MINELLSAQCIKQLQDFNQLIVGFSGGLDSTVLLHTLSTYPLLKSRLFAVHINHGISANALSWQTHCEQFCAQLNIPFKAYAVQFDKNANIEEAARNARYEVFSSLLKPKGCLILGHHLHDQAETVLLQLFRGAGIDGLAAMNAFYQIDAGFIARPLLSHSQEQLQSYALQHQLQWIVDESNQDIHYSRNYLRHQIMPLINKRWPGVISNLARTASHCQQAQMNLMDLALYDSQDNLSPSGSLSIHSIKSLSYERIANVLRFWLKNHNIQLPSTATFKRLIDEVLFASPDATPMVSWGDVQIRRYQDKLYLDKNQDLPLPKRIEWDEFPAPKLFAGGLMQVSAKKATQGVRFPPEAQISIRFRQGGEQFFWHGQTKQLKKLFQEWGIPPWRRNHIPLIFVNEQLAVVVGYAISDVYFSSIYPSWIINY